VRAERQHIGKNEFIYISIEIERYKCINSINDFSCKMTCLDLRPMRNTVSRCENSHSKIICGEEARRTANYNEKEKTYYKVQTSFVVFSFRKSK